MGGQLLSIRFPQSCDLNIRKWKMQMSTISLSHYLAMIKGLSILLCLIGGDQIDQSANITSSRAQRDLQVFLSLNER